MLSVVIPVYNFAEKIEENAQKLLRFLEENIGEFEIIFVDDGSTDGTYHILSKIASPAISVLSLERNTGKGAAVKAGAKESRGDLIIFTDADLPYGLEAIKRFVEQFRDGCEVILGSRRIVKGRVPATPYVIIRRGLSVIFLMLANLLLIKKVADAQCGMKGFTRNSALDLFGRLRIDGFAFDVELIYLAQKKGYRIVELPVTFLGSYYATSVGFCKSFRMLFDLLSLYMMYRCKGR